MAIDLNAIKAKLNQLQTTGNRRNNLWRPEPGKQIVRIVPYQHDRSNPFRELYFHYDLGKKNYLSPITNGNPDPVVEFCEKLKSSGNSDEWKLGKKMEPKMRTYVPILVRGLESEGVKFWGFGKQVYTELLGIISDPMGGRDILVEFTPAEAGAFPKTTIRVKPNVTPMTEDKNVAEQAANNQSNLDDIFKEPSYDDLKVSLEEWLNPDLETGSSTDARTDEPAAKKEAVPAGVNKVDDVSAAFDTLFND